jgi:hypothetical protein
LPPTRKRPYFMLAARLNEDAEELAVDELKPPEALERLTTVTASAADGPFGPKERACPWPNPRSA